MSGWDSGDAGALPCDLLHGAPAAARPEEGLINPVQCFFTPRLMVLKELMGPVHHHHLCYADSLPHIAVRRGMLHVL